MTKYINTSSDTMPNSLKKSFNVDSPSFTPATLPVPGKSAAMSSKAAAAAPFTPQGLASGAYCTASRVRLYLMELGTATPTPQSEPETTPFNPAQIREFTPGIPQNYDSSQVVSVKYFPWRDQQPPNLLKSTLTIFVGKWCNPRPFL